MLQHHANAGGESRDINDQYETPRKETNVILRELIDNRGGIKGPVLEPACGSGRMVRSIEVMTGLKVIGRDIQTGHDFMKRTKTHPGDMITNPPYFKDLPIQFTRKACEIVDGRVAMLLQAGFLWTTTREPELNGLLKPEFVLIIPWRIYFFRANGERIKGQAYSHAWVVWPEREKRPWTKKTELLIAKEP